MYVSPSVAEEVLQTTITALQKSGIQSPAALDELPAPIYVTDAEGFLTYFNRAAVKFAGRTPTVKHDRWCVTWKLYTDSGEFLPHEQCPMAVAIQQKQLVRGSTAVAERPDGTRVQFQPYPTPLFDADGSFLGAVNMLVDMTDYKRACLLQHEARRCRRLAMTIGDRKTSNALNQMAAEHDEKAAALLGS